MSVKLILMGVLGMKRDKKGQQKLNMSTSGRAPQSRNGALIVQKEDNALMFKCHLRKNWLMQVWMSSSKCKSREERKDFPGVPICLKKNGGA